MTIKDIAKLAGVSVSTVSRVLNNHPDVSETAKDKVLAVVAEYNYIPNTSARDLGKTTSDNIGVVVRGISNPFYTSILYAIGKEIERAGFTMVMQQIDESEDEIRTAAMMEREKRLLGVILLGGNFGYTKEQISCITVPFVCCTFKNQYGDISEADYSSVCIDDEQTAYEAVKHLFKQGKSRIAVLLSAEDDGTVSQLRFDGYKRALADAKQELDNNLIIPIHSFNIADAYNNMKDWLKKGYKFDALFAISDNIALGAMKALRDAGKKVPEDVSLIAIDGIEASEYSNPVLTTLCQPTTEIGNETVNLLVDLIDNKGENKHLTMPTYLREGETLRTFSN